MHTLNCLSGVVVDWNPHFNQSCHAMYTHNAVTVKKCSDDNVCNVVVLSCRRATYHM